MVAFWLQKVIKSKRIAGISVKPQQYVAIKKSILLDVDAFLEME